MKMYQRFEDTPFMWGLLIWPMVCAFRRILQLRSRRRQGAKRRGIAHERQAQ